LTNKLRHTFAKPAAHSAAGIKPSLRKMKFKLNRCLAQHTVDCPTLWQRGRHEAVNRSSHTCTYNSYLLYLGLILFCLKDVLHKDPKRKIHRQVVITNLLVLWIRNNLFRIRLFRKPRARLFFKLKKHL
jgi:hypothetical protein